MKPVSLGIRQDWDANRGNPKGQFVMSFFRMANAARKNDFLLFLPARVAIGIFYRILVEWILGIELPWRLSVGSGLRLFHGVGTVVNDGAIIGRNVTIRHNVTIGHTRPGGPCPRIGDNVDIGAGAILIGGITIGDDARIGAGALVIHDVAPGATVVSTPARVR